MRFEFGLRSSLLLIFFVHGVVYALLLWRKSIVKESASDKWLSIFLLLCVLYISPWMLGFAGWYDNQPYRDILFYTPMQHLLFIGPVIFFYVQSLLNPSFKFGKNEWLHFLPGILYLLYAVIMVVTDKLILHKYYFLADGSDRDFDSWYQWSGFFSMVFYFFLSIRYLNLYKKLMVQVISYADVVLFKWVKNFLLAFLGMQLLQFIFFIAGEINPYFSDYVGNWWYFLLFSFIFYYIAITGYSNAVFTKVPFKINVLGNKPLLFLSASPESEHADVAEDTYEGDLIEVEDISIEPINSELDKLVAEWKPKIEQLLQQDKLYEDPELSLQQMAKLLQTNPSQMSKMINQGFQMNFNDFINSYRIVAVKAKLAAGEQKTQTLLGIAYDCGFNSKATFNRAFKKFTQMSPKEWLEKLA